MKDSRNQVFAIAGHGIRSAVHSRALQLMSLVLLLIFLLLPAAIEGDSSPTGRLQLLLRYSAALVQSTIAIGVIWLSCSALSREISTRTIHHLITRPISSLTLWLGKWLSLMAIIFSMLTFSSLLSALVIHVELRRHHNDPDSLSAIKEQVLTARKAVSPRPRIPDNALIERTLAERRQRGEIPAAIPVQAARHMVIDALITSPVSIRPGEQIEWQFDLPVSFRDGSSLDIECRMLPASQTHRAPLHGEWMIIPDNRRPPVVVKSRIRTRAEQQINVPAENLTGARSLTVRYLNNERDEPVTAIIAPDGISVLIRKSGFLTNFIRAQLIALARLGLLAAVGITAGSILSLPVSVFACITLLTLPLMVRVLDDPVFSETAVHSHDGHDHEGHDHGSDDGMIARIPDTHKWAAALLRPLNSTSTIVPISTGRMIPYSDVGTAWGVQLGAYGLFVAALGIYAIRNSQYGSTRR